MPQKLLYSECKYGRLVAGQQPFEAVCPCCLTTMLIEACCQVDCGINADIYPLQTANNRIVYIIFYILGINKEYIRNLCGILKRRILEINKTATTLYA